ncbi:MAG TPA: hypothetical protein VL549_15280 [Gemmatimonadales bacterium]|nr:hypothetical protein [Gemmatimonadales bacterium]
MRPVLFVLLCCALACEEPRIKVVPVTVQWMDWPAEVNAGQTFRARLIVSGICAADPRFHPGSTADLSAVTFAPYFVTDDRPIACADVRASDVLVVIGIDTAGLAPALAASVARTYEMRGATWAYTYAPNALTPSLPVRLFGSITVRPSGADSSRRNGAGTVYLLRDSAGCARVRPIAAWKADTALALDDQADTVNLSGAFVRGYIYDTDVPVCGKTRLFHLVARE